MPPIRISMLPYVKDRSVIVDDPKTASLLRNKGAFGRSLPGGGLELSLMEAAYLISSGRLEVKRSREGHRISPHELLALGMDARERFLEDYLVFADMRDRGINIQGDGDRTFLVYPRGKGPGRGKAGSWIKVYREHDDVSIGGLMRETERREGMGMELLCAVVDGDWDLTYYSLRRALLSRSRKRTHPGKPDLGEDVLPIPNGGLLVPDGEVRELLSGMSVGSSISDSLALSREEAAFLRGEEGDGKTAVYRDLMERGFVVRTGFKYGTHFRVYTSGSIEEHSDILVHLVERDAKISWEALSRAIRLSHSVRKRMLFASIGKRKRVDYLEIRWTRP
ncbi:MAG TPA: tRNA-intron lyase [Euryarchaeota archaeon]|nr:tRNA-intron lyase [Euryarchaeota archaeon]